jgi:heme exporter protein D
MSLAEFVHMGGYGGYVWSCYGLTAVALAAMEWSSRRKLGRARKTAARRAAVAASGKS